MNSIVEVLNHSIVRIDSRGKVQISTEKVTFQFLSELYQLRTDNHWPFVEEVKVFQLEQGLSNKFGNIVITFWIVTTRAGI